MAAKKTPKKSPAKKKAKAVKKNLVKKKQIARKPATKPAAKKATATKKKTASKPTKKAAPKLHAAAKTVHAKKPASKGTGKHPAKPAHKNKPAGKVSHTVVKAVAHKKAAASKAHEPKAVEKPLRPLSSARIDEMRQAVITVLWRRENVPTEQLVIETKREITFDAGDDFMRYFQHVLDLLSRYNLIEQQPDKRPPHVRLAQRLDV